MIDPRVFYIRTHIWLKQLITQGVIGIDQINSRTIEDCVSVVIDIAFIPRTQVNTIISSLLIIKPVSVLFTPLFVDDLIDGMKHSVKLDRDSIYHNGLRV